MCGIFDGKIKEARRPSSKPLTWLVFRRAGRSARVPRRGISAAISIQLPALCAGTPSCLGRYEGERQRFSHRAKARPQRRAEPQQLINQTLGPAKTGHVSNARVAKRVPSCCRSSVGRRSPPIVGLASAGEARFMGSHQVAPWRTLVWKSGSFGGGSEAQTDDGRIKSRDVWLGWVLIFQ